MRDILLFSHANGFPVRTYRKLFGALEDEFEIHAVERFGHDPKYPVTREWPHLVDELLGQLDRAGREGADPRQVWLVGHSLGGFLSLMASLRRPARVRGVVMLDSPIIAGWRASLLRASQIFGLDEKPGPAAVTKKRRTHWPDAEAVWSHFQSKKNFAIWDPEVLRDYTEHGTEPTGRAAERKLRFDREVEYQIYRTLPTSLGRKVARGSPVPVGFIAGTRSREVRQAGLGATRRLVGERLRFIEGGHLYPMEKPLETADLVRDLIGAMRRDGR
ncbi:Pimeloyl-ACP methyl ester carboxylesterase [Cupriavidus sp. YR651]|uniref:alpha/beta fold hydrolase n=1 Tax=Cupriavidus sp. YR651 TaxID=1855315 RepID=UPI00088EE673|nr:alpha/beta hydrolase [Cupriavidus sp. YR651]SDD23119.1 Pimeloyl-ACP methyl ester carboxylesterase [Cupriavidus sp. YR651]